MPAPKKIEDTQQPNTDLMLELEKKVRDAEKLRRKAVTDQVLRFLGLILAAMIFLISFSMLASLTLFARLVGPNSAEEVWRSGLLANVFQDGSIYYSFIGPDPTVAILLMTIIQVSLAVALAFLVSYYIRDLIGIIKNILNLGKNLTDELGTNIKEGVQDLVGSNKEKKSLFGDQPAPAEAKPAKPAKKSRAEKELEKLYKEAEKNNVEIQKPELVTLDPEDAELDKALTDPNYVPQPKPVEEPKKASLFDKR